MKLHIPFLLALFAAAVICHAQDDPGRVQSVDSPIPIQTDSENEAQPMFVPPNSPISQTSTAIAEAVTPDIQALAQDLGYDPTRMFNYVHDQIRYVHYFGSKKGAELTLLERCGNDFDQCALLSALLQAAGYSPTYQFAVMQMPYDSPTNHQDLHHWLCLNMANTNFLTNTLNYFDNFLSQRGNYIYFHFGTNNTFGFQRIWLTLTMGGTTYYLDPSFKVSEPVAGANIGSAMGLNTNTLWTAAGGTDTGSYVSGLNEGALRGALQSCNTNLLFYLSNNIPDATVAQVIGGQQIVSSVGLPLRTNLLFPVYTNSTYPLLNWTNQPTNFMGTFSVSFAGSNQTWYTPQLQGQRISLTFSNNGVAQLWVEDTPVMQVNHPSASNTVNVVFTATHPYGGWSTSQNIPIDTGPFFGFDGGSTNTYQTTNASYSIMYAFEANQAWLQKRQQKLNAYLAAGYTNGSRQVTCETLNVMGLGWLVQTELVEELLSQEWGQLPQNHHRFGRMGQELGRGYYVDAYLQLDGTFPNTGYNAPDVLANNEVFDVSSYFWSAMEHGIIEQLQNSNLVAASTVKMIEIASTNSQKVYLANSGNWSTVRSSLTRYGLVTNTLNTRISQGFTLLLPQDGSNNIAGTGTWGGDGYVELGTNGSRTMGMMIGGGYNGGFVSSSGATVNPPLVNQIGQSQPFIFNPQLATLAMATQYAGDPVNMVDGTFQVASDDLVAGQTEPRGLHLTRYYSSERIHSNPTGMAPGWLHSYYCNATAISDPQGGLGGETVGQMSPMITATYAALSLYNNVAPDPKNWTMTALMAKWGIDQLINNAVSINLGNSTLEFTRQPDGSYTPPGNCTMTLTNSGAALVLQERHGRTFKFNTNSLLTNIVDQYGQSMVLAYNSSNLVSTVTDWAGRSLAFHYAAGVLTNVSDSTGRSVSYGYSGGELTSYTDPDSNTASYAYDTNNEMVATFDGLNNLVVSNYYDGNGHVTLQLTEGSTNKAWQIAASGCQTVAVDPAGDETVYTYDQKSRLIAFQDGMGNITQTVYDGQDHVIATISPLGETNQMFYDGNNNLIETIDPLGYSNVYTFDANNNLITSIDQRHNTSYFGYNSQFSPTGVTNGNGDWLVLAYNTDGTLHSRQDSGGTTSYGYDSYGILNSVTYPGSLGSESFVNNALGDPASHTDARSFTTTFAYNNRRQLTNTVAPTNLTASASFDANGNLSTVTDPRRNLTSNHWSTTRKLLTTTLPSTPQGTPVITRAYDNRDWLASMQNPLGQTAYYTNDAAQRLIAATDPLQRATLLSYDHDGHETTSTDAAGDLTTQTWDARGNPIKTVDAATNTVGKAYDGAGNLVYLTNRNGKVWTFQYDGANRLTNTVSPLGHSASGSYNNRGLPQSTTDPLSQTTSFTYDARGRMATKVDNLGTIDYQFDANNNLTSLTNVGAGSQLSWAYDAYNCPTSFTNAIPPPLFSLNTSYGIQYRHDANGNLTNLVYPTSPVYAGNLAVSYYYDNNNRLTNVTDWNGMQTTFTYDLAGHLTGVHRPNNTVRAMAYDAAGELTNIVEKTTAQFPIAFQTLSYNAAGRVQWEFKGPLPHSNSAPTRTMTYDNDNRLATFNGTNATVDADGNMTYGPLPNNTFGTYAYDARNELTGAGGWSYGYDPAGNRISVTSGGGATTSYMIDPQTSRALMRFKAISSGGYVSYVTTYYIYGPGLLYEINVTLETDGEIVNGAVECPCSVLQWTTNTAFYHYDSRGSTVALTDNNGNPTDLIEYSSYGTTTYRYGTNTTPFLYNGQFGVQTDPNGLLYMRARYYNPYICRFINADPSGFGGGLNMYAFCNGNPINLADPFGLCPDSTEGWGGATATWIQNNIGNYFNSVSTGSTYFNYSAYMIGSLVNGLADTLRLGQGTANATYNSQDGWDVAIGITQDIQRATGITTLAGGFAVPYAASSGVLNGANYAQRTFSSTFSSEGTFAGQTVEDVADALQSGALSPDDVPIQYIVQDGNTLILNTRSAQALEQAGIPRSAWNAVDMTGDASAQARLAAQLQRNGLTSQGTPTVVPKGQ